MYHFWTIPIEGARVRPMHDTICKELRVLRKVRSGIRQNSDAGANAGSGILANSATDLAGSGILANSATDLAGSGILANSATDLANHVVRVHPVRSDQHDDTRRDRATLPASPAGQSQAGTRLVSAGPGTAEAGEAAGSECRLSERA